MIHTDVLIDLQALAFRSICDRSARLHAEADPRPLAIRDLEDFRRIEAEALRIDAAVLMHANMHDPLYRAQLDDSNPTLSALVQETAVAAGMRALPPKQLPHEVLRCAFRASGTRQLGPQGEERRGAAKAAERCECGEHSFTEEPERRELQPPSTTAEGLRAFLRNRDVPEDVAMTVATLVGERFPCNDIYVGRLLGQRCVEPREGFLDDLSYCVELDTLRGSALVWGLDLKRALLQGGVTEGDDVMLVYRGRQSVTATVKAFNERGQVIGTQDLIARRPTWTAFPLETVRAEAGEAIQAPVAVAR